MSADTLRFEIDAAIATVTIDRESSLNALNRQVLEELAAAIVKLKDYPLAECRMLILRGAGDKAFVAGADIKQMQQAAADELRAFVELGQAVMRGLTELPIPVISVVQGFALGGGMELALASDLIVASKQAKFGQPEVNLGLIPGFGGTQRLSLRVGVGTARRLIYTGETIGGAEAHRIGLVDYLTEPEELAAQVQALTQTLLARGPLAIAASKRAIDAPFKAATQDGLENEVEEFIALFNFKDTTEGLNAFVEKRKAEFTGE